MHKEVSGKSSCAAAPENLEQPGRHDRPNGTPPKVVDGLQAEKLASFRKEQVEFLREINHKLSQPATSLRFCLEFASRGNEAKLREAVGQARGLTENLIDLVNAVRDLSEALDPGDIQESLDLGDSARNALSQIGSHTANFIWKKPPATAGSLTRIHRGRLQRALINLFIEASTDCAAGERVSLNIAEGPEQICLSCVYRSGPQARVPEKFFHPFATRGSTMDGRALSVALSQRIAEAAGGTLELIVSGAQRELRFSLPKC